MICNMDCNNDQLTPDDYKASTHRARESVQDNRDAKGQRLAAQKKIRARRKAAGYTQRGLAALIGVTRSAVSLWENCKGPADWDKLEAVFPNIKKEVLTNDR